MEMPSTTMTRPGFSTRDFDNKRLNCLHTSTGTSSPCTSIELKFPSGSVRILATTWTVEGLGAVLASREITSAARCSAAGCVSQKPPSTMYRLARLSLRILRFCFRTVPSLSLIS